MTPDTAVPLDRRMLRGTRRRRLGLGLVAFGLSGLALVVAAALLVLGSLAAISDAATGFERQRTEIVELLGPTSDALSDAANAATNATSSLQESGDAAARAAGLTTRLADAFDGLAALGSFEILGARPFGGVSGQFAQTSAESRALSADLAAAAAALQTNAADSAAVADDLRTLSARLSELEADVRTDGAPGAPTLPIGLALLVLVGLLTWLSIPAIVATWLGWRLLRTARRG